MEESILLAGPNTASCVSLAASFASYGYNPIIAGDNSHDTVPESFNPTSNIKLITWNKASLISARTLLLQLETLTGPIKNALFYFDSTIFSKLYPNYNSALCNKASDNMITSYQYLILETLTRIKQKKSPCRLIFLLKSKSSLCEIEHSSTLKKAGALPSSLFVSGAQAAFQAFCENVACTSLEDKYTSTLLINANEQNEVAQDASIFVSWLKEYIETLGEKRDSAGNLLPQKSTYWIKAGQKPSGSFSIFRR